MDAGSIEITPATEAQRPLIEGLFQFYVYDFSELEPAGSDHFEPDGRGSFGAYPYIESYWQDPTRTALIIRRGEMTAGFALINAVSHSGAAVDRNMAEFFIMRKHRRGGVGRAAVSAILTRYPGRWEIAVAQRNTPARAFWPAAVAATPGVRGLATLQGDGLNWTGPILSFTVEAHGAAEPGR